MVLQRVMKSVSRSPRNGYVGLVKELCCVLEKLLLLSLFLLLGGFMYPVCVCLVFFTNPFFKTIGFLSRGMLLKR